MPRHGARGGDDDRGNLDEIDVTLRDRLLALDEPVDRADWEAVVRRSSGLRRSGRYSTVLVGGCALVLSLAFAVSVLPLVRHGGKPGTASGPLRLSLQLSDGRGLVLYSVADHAGFFDNSDDRVADVSRQQDAAVVQRLNSGPFHVPVDVAHATRSSQHAFTGPLPGDRALVSLRVFTNAGLETPAGSAVLVCEYGLDGTAYCDGAFDLQDGLRLTGSGTLDADVRHYTLVVTVGDGHGLLTASPPDSPDGEL
jgi:hypothetical protein